MNSDIDYILQKGSSGPNSSPPFATEEENGPSLLMLRFEEQQKNYTFQCTSQGFCICYSVLEI
jgi:hypothetical protein